MKRNRELVSNLVVLVNDAKSRIDQARMRLKQRERGEREELDAICSSHECSNSRTVGKTEVTGSDAKSERRSEFSGANNVQVSSRWSTNQTIFLEVCLWGVESGMRYHTMSHSHQVANNSFMGISIGVLDVSHTRKETATCCYRSS